MHPPLFTHWSITLGMHLGAGLRVVIGTTKGTVRGPYDLYARVRGDNGYKPMRRRYAIPLAVVAGPIGGACEGFLNTLADIREAR